MLKVSEVEPLHNLYDVLGLLPRTAQNMGVHM